jgi:hypothetical protein
MKTDIKTDWKTNLRSGEFAQGLGQLRAWDANNKVWAYCYLGILCEMSGLGEWEEVKERDGHCFSTYLGSKHYLPDEVAEWAGIAPVVDTMEGVQQRIGTMNDSGATFLNIAEALDATHDL